MERRPLSPTQMGKPVSPGQMVYHNSFPQKEADQKRKTIWIVVIILLAVLVIGIIMCFAWGKCGNKPVPVPDPTPSPSASLHSYAGNGASNAASRDGLSMGYHQAVSGNGRLILSEEEEMNGAGAEYIPVNNHDKDQKQTQQEHSRPGQSFQEADPYGAKTGQAYDVEYYNKGGSAMGPLVGRSVSSLLTSDMSDLKEDMDPEEYRLHESLLQGSTLAQQIANRSHIPKLQAISAYARRTVGGSRMPGNAHDLWTGFVPGQGQPPEALPRSNDLALTVLDSFPATSDPGINQALR